MTKLFVVLAFLAPTLALASNAYDTAQNASTFLQPGYTQQQTIGLLGPARSTAFQTCPFQNYDGRMLGVPCQIWYYPYGDNMLTVTFEMKGPVYGQYIISGWNVERQ